MREWLDLANQNQPHTVRLRREIHEYPELGEDLPKTKAAVLRELQPLGLDIIESPKTSSFVARMQTGRPGKTLILRADMDALPMQEETGLDYASKVPGRMHACGHDCHTAMLTTAARILHAHSDRLSGEIRFVFQANEEGDGGARVMMEEGMLEEGGSPDAAFALHILPTQKAGTVHSRHGAVMASANEFYIQLTGAGGHAATPYLSNDPIPVASQIILALHNMVTRRFTTFEPIVLTVGTISAGSTPNSIPTTVDFAGTVRTCNPGVFDEVYSQICRISQGIADAHDMKVSIQASLGSGPTINDPDFTDRVERVVNSTLGQGGFITMQDPYMAAEDFSEFLAAWPGTYANMGVAPEGQDPSACEPLHSTKMVVNEDALAFGVATHVAVAMDYLGGS